MSHEHSTTAGGWLDAPGRVAGEVCCVACGYNLHGQPGDHVCPECGLPVADSAPLEFRPPRQLRRLKLATLLILLGLVGPIVWDSLYAWVLGQFYPPPDNVWPELGETIRIAPPFFWHVVVRTIGNHGASATGLVGVILLTFPCADAARRRAMPWQRTARWLAYVTLGWLVVATVAEILWLPRQLYNLPGTIAGTILDVLLLASAVATLAYACHLVRWAHRRWLRRFANALWWIGIPAAACILAFWGYALVIVTSMPAPQLPFADAIVQPTVHVQPSPGSAPASSPDQTQYLIYDVSRTITRTTTAPAEYVKRGDEYRERLKAAARTPSVSFETWLFLGYGVLAAAAVWGLSGLVLLAVFLRIVIRAEGKGRAVGAERPG